MRGRGEGWLVVLVEEQFVGFLILLEIENIACPPSHPDLQGTATYPKSAHGVKKTLQKRRKNLDARRETNPSVKRDKNVWTHDVKKTYARREQNVRTVWKKRTHGVKKTRPMTLRVFFESCILWWAPETPCKHVLQQFRWQRIHRKTPKVQASPPHGLSLGFRP